MENINKKQGSEFADALIKEVRKELNANKGDWKRIVKLSNGSIGYAWLSAIGTGRIRATRIDKISELAMFLGMRLQVAPGPHFNKFVP